jgi:nicotinate-nucleotide pyrophosphorylase (carboxylating)
VDAIEGTGARILDTRKTVPGMRQLEKYAVRCGGGFNHRLDLSDGILVKNNHIDLAGGVEVAVARALANRKGEQTVEVEVRDMRELEDALNFGAESILLDNMTPELTRTAVAYIRAQKPEMKIESSGGITLENIRQYAEAGVDFISVGALTHSASAVDLSMRIEAV